MNSKLKKLLIFIVVVVIAIIISILFIINQTDKVRLPTTKVIYENYSYEFGSEKKEIIKRNLKSGISRQIIKGKINPLGFMIFSNRIFFIKTKENELVSTDLEGGNLILYGSCGSLYDKQCLFVLGKHLYYHDAKEVLFRVNNNGNLDKIGMY